jgi:hypothetical protein
MPWLTTKGRKPSAGNCRTDAALPVARYFLPWAETFSGRTCPRYSHCRSRPSPYSIALLALTLGIGANTTIFSVVEIVLIKALLHWEAGRLVDLFEKQA